MAVNVHHLEINLLFFFSTALIIPKIKKEFNFVPTFTSFFINPTVMKNTSKHYDLHAKVTIPK
jgi:hypothetical protein